ncbi:tetratricopeptide repeat protein [Vibrio navarrensis]
MDDKDVIIAILAGLVTNFLTFLVTKNLTSNQERQAFIKEEQKARSNIAESAIGHLRSTYYAVKQLSIEVMQKQYENRDNENFNTTLWGIKHGLEQLRLGLQGHMNTWKNELESASPSVGEINKIIQEDVVIGSVPSIRPLSDTASLSQSSSTSKKQHSPDKLGKNLIDQMTTSPQEKIVKIIASGDLNALEDLVIIEAGKNGDIELIVALGGMAVLSGSEKSHGVLLDVFRTRYEELDASGKNALFTSICQFYVRTDREKEGYPICRELLATMENDGQLEDSNKAHAYNQLAIVAHHAGELTDTMALGEKAIKLAPDDKSYLHNHALTLKKLGKVDEAERMLMKALELGKYEDIDHLETAVSFFSDIEKTDKAEEFMEKLRKLDPQRAEIRSVMNQLKG